ncbi:ArsR family transcriptional regulator [Halorubrum sp. CBA1125]|uniref:IclR family transcriptional regulator n=1 Tax=Halorubrum sp. CBA1125 TaxID=2668072 RepID=UPI0012E92901|nr:IclR family transcriptional regulator [Halorubrum sp. CBA1125]MUW13980.1 ArsR family transcriptional regulator [Halorubrum sp. CBA1125]
MSRKIRSVAKACEIIRLLRERNGATVSELSAATDLSPGTVHTHLATLREANFVVQRDNEYHLGFQLLTLGEHVRHHQALYRAAKEQVDQLAEETGECAHLIIEHDGHMYALYERFGPEAVGTEYHDRKREQPLNHLHCTAAGKAILAAMSSDQARETLRRRELPQLTDHTITDVDELMAEIEETQHRQYAIADEEQMHGIRAVGSPVTLPNRENIGAIAVSGPTARLPDDRLRESFAEKVIQATNICEVNLQSAEDRIDVR